MHDRFEELVAELGAVGQRMTELQAAEGAAGNLSLFIRDDPRLPDQFSARGTITLPVATPDLIGGSIVITASGRRLRDISSTPETTLCVLRITAAEQATLLSAHNDLRLTSEANTHLAVHNAHVALHDLNQHAVVHAQPLRITYLSHLAAYADQATFERALLRWQPETIMEFPEGIGTLPFQLPGSADQMTATVAALRQRRAVVWQKHGIVTRAHTIGKAADLVEYAEAAARYEYLNMCAGSPVTGLTDDELRAIADRLRVHQTVF